MLVVAARLLVVLVAVGGALLGGAAAASASSTPVIEAPPGEIPGEEHQGGTEETTEGEHGSGHRDSAAEVTLPILGGLALLGIGGVAAVRRRDEA